MTRFLISDTHFGHELMTTLRKFKSVEEHDEFIISAWNDVVAPNDIVFHLGDVFVGQKHEGNYGEILSRLNGKKRLILGNHDTSKRISEFLPYFESIKAYEEILNKDIVLSHIPIHNSQLKNAEGVGRWKMNVHGHLHSAIVGDTRYVNVSVERCANFAPIPFDSFSNLYTKGQFQT